MSGLKEELKKLCKYPSKILQIIGCNPTDSGEFNTKNLVLIMCCPLYCLWSSVSATFVHSSELSLIEISVHICGILATFLCGYRFFNYVINRQQYFKLINIIEEEFWGKNELSSHDEKCIILSYGRFCNIITTIQVISLFLTGPLWIIEPILQMAGLVPTYGNKTELILPFDIWLPFNLEIHQHPLYDILYAIQTCGAMGCVAILSCADTLFVFIVLNVCGQFQLLQYRLINLTKTEMHSKTQETFLKNCIHQHQNLLKFCYEFEVIINKSLGVQFISSAGFLCVSGLTISLYPDDTYNVYRSASFIITSTWELFLLCYMAELLTSEVSHAAYNSIWYESSDYVKQSIVLIIMQSQVTFHLTAWKLQPVSLESFEMVLRNAVSYFTVFNSVRGDL